MAIDLILVVLAALAVYRGYRRGLIREAADLAVLVVAAIVAFRTASASEAFFASWTGVSPLVARTLGAFGVFFALQLAGSFLARRALAVLTPLRPFDRVAGAAMAAAWFVISSVLLILVLSATPVGDTVDGWMEESRAVSFVAGEDSVPKRAISGLVGDRVLESLVNLNQLLGDRQVVIDGTELVELPMLDGALTADEEAASAVFDLLNLARVDAGQDPLAWSGGLAEVASDHATEMYMAGYFSHVSPITGDVADRVQSVAIPYSVVGENLALSPTAESVHDGLLASPGHRANMLEARFTRVGIAAVQGPLGLMVVEVFTG